jgi:hypothetical protein
VNTPLDPLADFRPDGYGLDDERRARLRSRVLDAIPDDAGAGVSTLVTARPSTAASARVDERDELADLHVLEPLAAGDARRPGRSPRRGQGHNGRRLLVAAAIAVTLGLLAVMVGTTRSGNREVGTVDESTVTLDDLAVLASSLPDRKLAAGEHQRFERTEGLRREDGGFDVTNDRNWHTTDDSGGRQTTTMVWPAGGIDGDEIDRTDTRFVDDPACLMCFGPFDYDAMRSASADPAVLLVQARAAMPDESIEAVAEQLTLLEALTTAPPDVRAAALGALDRIGFEPLGLVADPHGRSGMAFVVTNDDQATVVVFNPESATALAYWRTPLGTAGAWRTATRWVTFSDVAVTGFRA